MVSTAAYPALEGKIVLGRRRGKESGSSKNEGRGELRE